ncbi:MAG TPA: xanthine dehydrogenase molybdopterin binding subunit [Alphaproteobacteria bacterium]|nr:xanthine dehydrogenase molybdopterin binding subunit [Alphaproteobacteria bacterium]
MPDDVLSLPEAKRNVHRGIAHESARKHVSGEAVYADDIVELPGTLHTYVRMADRAHARIIRLDVARAREVPGVHAAITAADVPGEVDIGSVFPGDPMLTPGLVEYMGQAIVAIAADSIEIARRAAALVEIEYEDLPAILDAKEALEKKFFVSPSTTMRIGDAQAALAKAPHRMKGDLRIGGQDHFYLEGQIAYAIPDEDGNVLVHSSTQNPTEVQHLIAKVLDVPDAAVTVDVRRMGGGFGGKETQPAQIAAIAALLAVKTGRPVKYRMDRDDDMIMTGKRHDFYTLYDVGFDEEGRILGAEFELAARCGMSPDLSNAIVDRAQFHADNAYYLGNATVTGHRCKTHTVSNTAFRGFGGPQGMVGIEYVVDDIARFLGKDPLDVRKLNLYGKSERNVTHYHQTITDNILPELIDEVERTSDYRARRLEIASFNASSKVIKRGLALTPVKFGISFTATHLNQGGALVHVYTDGSVHLNHGGTEMGQGLFVKVAQIVADEFGIDLDQVQVSTTTTGKVPNTSATAGSAGCDLNGMAAQAAARTIKERLVDYCVEQYKVPAETVLFHDGMVRVGNREIEFPALVKEVYRARISLSSTGFYKTPKIWWNPAESRGRPFFYYTYGAAATEVELDTLTGEYRMVRADLLQDCGRSINPAIDLGQVEGGYVQGVGWLTSEELWWDETGRLRTHSPSTYKIPTSRDVPPDFRVKLFTAPNTEDTVHRSKAVGEPPFMLAISAFLALKDAVASLGQDKIPVRLDAPATPERVLFACEAVRARLGKAV